MTSQLAPFQPPASSSAVEQNMMSRRSPGIGSEAGSRPAALAVAARRRMTCTSIATMDFMSRAPRPQIYPRSISAPNGSWVQPSGGAGTTSRCDSSSSGSPPLPSPRTRQTMEPRPRNGSTTWGFRPASISTCSRYRAALISPPGGFTVGMRISACKSSISSASSRSGDFCLSSDGLLGAVSTVVFLAIPTSSSAAQKAAGDVEAMMTG